MALPLAEILPPLLAAGWGREVVDPFRLLLALGPLASYLVVLGLVSLSSRPRLTTGARDAAALGLAMVGLILVGPVELLMPRAAAQQLGPVAWLMWICLYALSVALVALVQRPRLVIYNISADELHPILDEVVHALDPQALWAGDSLLLPSLGVQLHVDAFGLLRNVSLAAVGERQAPEGWRALERGLATALGRAAVPANPRGVALGLVGMMVLVVLAVSWISDPQALSRSFVDMFGLQ